MKNLSSQRKKRRRQRQRSIDLMSRARDLSSGIYCLLAIVLLGIILYRIFGRNMNRSVRVEQFVVGSPDPDAHATLQSFEQNLYAADDDTTTAMTTIPEDGGDTVALPNETVQEQQQQSSQQQSQQQSPDPSPNDNNDSGSSHLKQVQTYLLQQHELQEKQQMHNIFDESPVALTQTTAEGSTTTSNTEASGQQSANPAGPGSMGKCNVKTIVDNDPPPETCPAKKKPKPKKKCPKPDPPPPPPPPPPP